MKARKKIILITIPLVLTFFISMSYLVFSIEMKSVVLNSKAYAEEKSKAFKMMINIELQNLEELCKDWAFWDDTYEFIENRNKNYIASNLVESTFRDARINLIIFLNKNDEIVYSKFYNERWEEKEIDEIFLKREFMKKTGFMKFGQHLILISSKPILKSDLSGEERGHLLMGRILDDEWFFKISEALNVKIQLKDVKEVYNEKIVARTEVEDILGEKLVFALEFTNPNYIDHIRDIFLYIFSFLILVLFFYSTTIFLIDRELISKISRLEMFVSKAKAGDRVEVTGVDEINELTSGINRMLSRIEKKERETNFLLKILKHDLMNVLASLSGYLEIMKLEGKLNNLEKAEKQIDRGVTLIKAVEKLETEEIMRIRIGEVVEKLREIFPIDIELRGDATILADEGIYVIFSNLIDNSIKHGNASKIFLEIEKDKEVFVRFRDNGKGFSKTAMERAFKDIYIEGSTGLGLLIVKKLVEKYNGTVQILDENTIFMRFPNPYASS